MPNYATKFDLRCIKFDTWKFGKTAHLASSKSDVEKFDIDKLKVTPMN